MNDQRLRETTCTKLEKKFDEQFKSIYEDGDTINESYVHYLEKIFRENKDNIELIEKAKNIGVDFKIEIFQPILSNCSGRKYPKVHLKCIFRNIK